MRRVLVGILSLAGAAILTLVTFSIASAQTGDPVAGKTYWDAATTWCSRCHGVNGEGAYGPDLAGRGLSAEQFGRAVRQPWGVMPAFTERQASEQNIADMVAYFSSLPKVAEPGPWRTTVPAGAPLGQKLLIETAGCGQCHGEVLGSPRRVAGGEGADFAQFEEWIYEHTVEFPTGRMGNYSRGRLPEENLMAIWNYVSEDLGLRVPMSTILRAATAADGSVTYTLTLENTGEAGHGLAAEDIFISMLVPTGSSVSAATGEGSQGVGGDEATGTDLAVWVAPRLEAGRTLTYTMTVSGGGAASGSHAYVHWDRPTRFLQPGISGDYNQTAHILP